MATAQHKQRLVMQEQTRDQVAPLLQHCLVNLIDLALQGKQAHWNLIGHHFRSFHLQLDDIVDTAHDASDEVAERIAALNVAADGRVETIHSQSKLDAFPEGRQQVEAAVSLIADRLNTTIHGLRDGIDQLNDLDLVSQDMLIGICGKLEKHLWMVQVQEE
jgi:starvation-inducible DNA-binding protein